MRGFTIFTVLSYFLFDFPGSNMFSTRIQYFLEHREYELKCFLFGRHWWFAHFSTDQAFSVELFPVAFARYPDSVERKKIFPEFLWQVKSLSLPTLLSRSSGFWPCQQSIWDLTMVKTASPISSRSSCANTLQQKWLCYDFTIVTQTVLELGR